MEVLNRELRATGNSLETDLANSQRELTTTKEILSHVEQLRDEMRSDHEANLGRIRHEQSLELHRAEMRYEDLLTRHCSVSDSHKSTSDRLAIVEAQLSDTSDELDQLTQAYKTHSDRLTFLEPAYEELQCRFDEADTVVDHYI